MISKITKTIEQAILIFIGLVISTQVFAKTLKCEIEIEYKTVDTFEIQVKDNDPALAGFSNKYTELDGSEGVISNLLIVVSPVRDSYFNVSSELEIKESSNAKVGKTVIQMKGNSFYKFDANYPITIFNGEVSDYMVRIPCQLVVN